AHEMSEGIMFHEFDGLDATEKAGIGTELNRCRALATKIANELRNKRPEHFVDKLSLADVHASLERAADVLSRPVLVLVEFLPDSRLLSRALSRPLAAEERLTWLIRGRKSFPQMRYEAIWDRSYA